MTRCSELVEANDLAGSGLGWIDVHLLASARVSGVRLWTGDVQLKKIRCQAADCRSVAPSVLLAGGIPVGGHVEPRVFSV